MKPCSRIETFIQSRKESEIAVDRISVRSLLAKSCGAKGNSDEKKIQRRVHDLLGCGDVRHPSANLRLYEREGLLKPSRTEGNTRLYTDEDLQRLEFILSLARDLGVNIAGMAIILQMRERMEEMQHQIQEFVQYIQQEVLTRANAAADPSKGAIVPVRRSMISPSVQPSKKR